MASSYMEHALGNIGSVVWTDCTTPFALHGAECGYALVPLDYTNQSAGVAKIALGRYNATSPNRRAPCNGVILATSAGSLLQGLVGEEWDIIGFDPRGIGLSEPAVQCFPGNGTREAFIANTVLDRGYDVSPDPTDPANWYHLIETQRDANALYKTQFEKCKEVQGDSLRYMGTTSVVRDIDFIATALEGNGSLINFYGWSYGTVMGQYLVNMFPDRVGRVVIDGVADANAWANDPPYVQVQTWLNSTEFTYRIFFEDCAKAGPSLCALAKREGENPSNIYDRVEAFIDKLYEEPLPVPNATTPSILTNGRARIFFTRTLEMPESWGTAAQSFDSAMNGNASAVLNALAFGATGDPPDLQRSAVTCNDEKPFAPPTPETLVGAALRSLQDISRFYFSAIITEPDSGCQYWPFTPPERYLGPWNNTPKNPVLIISNTADPITPLVNGERVHSYFPNDSALLVQDSPGHTSAMLRSNCTVDATRKYFADATLPAPGTVCLPNSQPFAPGSGNGRASKAVKSRDNHPVRDVRRLSSFLARHLGYL
ncbi:TAP-like protein-domain-containing protein [Ganoderma leucocontextum]|nr:TAP-like protein-domain-containing protein [Ganoderma leucocontextum]